MTDTYILIDTFTDELYSGRPISASRLAEAAGVVLTSIERAVEAGVVRGSLRTIGTNGRTLHGIERLHIVPLWA